MIGKNMLRRDFLAVMEANTVDGLRNQVTKFAQSMGFGTVSAIAVIERTPVISDFYAIDNTPDDFLSIYQNELAFLRDPVMQHCKRTSTPLIWDQHTYVESGTGELWEQQSHYGYRNGIAFALHLPDGRHFAFGVDTDRPMPSSSRRLTQIVAELQLFAVYAQDAALRVLIPPEPALPAKPVLTARELEVLSWTMEGKTAFEVAERLNLSERTAVFHLMNAMRKLRCNSKYQAVLTAIRFGILS